MLMIAFLFACGNIREKESSEEKVDTQDSALHQQAGPEIEVEVDSSDQAAITLSSDEPEATEPASIQSESEQADNEIAHLFRQGTKAYENDDFTGGIEYFEKVIARGPRNAGAYYNLGVGYFNLERYQKALDAFSNAISIYPNDSLSYQFRGRVHYLTGNFESCLKDYEKVVELRPDDPVAYYNRGTAKGRLRDYLGAIKDFDRALELRPDYAEVYYNRGLANFYQGRLHDACFDWRKAHSLGHYEAEIAIRSYCEGGEKQDLPPADQEE